MLRHELVPILEGRGAFQARVAANALDIIVRELDLSSSANRAELARLERLLDKTGDLDTLNRQLCRAIAAGELTLSTPGLADHLWRTTLDKLAIDQPDYATYRRVLEEQQADPATVVKA
jgi:hypothetical protein